MHVRMNHETHEIMVDLTNKSFVSDRVHHGYGYPMLTFQEQIAASKLPMNFGPFLESINKRGLNIKEVCLFYHCSRETRT